MRGALSCGGRSPGMGDCAHVQACQRAAGGRAAMRTARSRGGTYEERCGQAAQQRTRPGQRGHGRCEIGLRAPRHAPAACRCTACLREGGGACTPLRTSPSRGPGCASTAALREQECARRFTRVCCGCALPRGTQLHDVAHKLRAQQHPAAANERLCGQRASALAWQCAPPAQRTVKLPSRACGTPASPRYGAAVKSDIAPAAAPRSVRRGARAWRGEPRLPCACATNTGRSWALLTPLRAPRGRGAPLPRPCGRRSATTRRSWPRAAPQAATARRTFKLTRLTRAWATSSAKRSAAAC